MIISKALVQALMNSLLSDQGEISLNGFDSLYYTARSLFYETDGLFNSSANKIIGITRSINHSLDNSQILQSLREHGYYVDMLQPAMIDKARIILNSFLSYSVMDQTGIKRYTNFKELLGYGPLRELLFGIGLKEIADAYLNCDSILNSISIWDTPGTLSSDSSSMDKQAMLFHRDADHNKFMKVFIYLSDVGFEDGPHQYVPASHHPRSHSFLGVTGDDCRLTPSQVILSNLDIQTCAGPEGQIIFADTHCLHRGTRPHLGHHRYLMQLQFVDSLLGPTNAYPYGNPLHLPCYPF